MEVVVIVAYIVNAGFVPKVEATAGVVVEAGVVGVVAVAEVSVGTLDAIGGDASGLNAL